MVLSALIFPMAHIHCLRRVMVINIHCRLMGVVINIHCRYQSPLRPRRFQPQSPQSQYSTKATPASHTRLADWNTVPVLLPLEAIRAASLNTIRQLKTRDSHFADGNMERSGSAPRSNSLCKAHWSLSMHASLTPPPAIARASAAAAPQPPPRRRGYRNVEI